MNKIVKKIGLIITAAALAATVCSCGAAGDASSSADSKASEASLGAITVISREDGSGTRGAFTELLGVVDADKKDATVDSAEVTNSTSVMLTTVAGNKSSIGYVSLGSLSDSVKAIKLNGSEPTVENIESGKYILARPFNVVYRDGSLSANAADFMNFVLSPAGQKIVGNDGYISVTADKEYTAAGLSGKVTLAGSTSVSPLMEKLVDEYKKLNPNMTIEIQQTGSSAGITSATDGVCDLGMSSRELKDTEKSGMTCVKIATDGIAIIVNKANSKDNITADQAKDIYLGNLTDWSKVG